ncbi:ABC transporter substrate-binding protein [Flavobacteriaceae bacterium R33]|uniref:ABC transporter substrate-binding protein n=2 Tax=Poritiphilus flavus TaxID=2697053 RepID=A0A6L9EA92_9FLAO|nr:ABC transporter substrate-binding protein [Poritiphilus flavus]
MGLQEHLVGITFECPEQALKEKPTVVQCVLEGLDLSSRQINSFFSASKRDGESLYYVNEDLLEELKPDVIFTQDVCEVCQIDTECTMAAVAKLPKQPEIISITPQSLEDVFKSAEVIATAMGVPEKGHKYTRLLRNRISETEHRFQKSGSKRQKVFFMEWMDPIFNSGHWIPDQVRIAGGKDKLSNPCGDSTGMHWEELVKYDPDILVIAPCGFSIERTLSEISLLTSKTGWETMSAVRNNKVYIADFELFTQSSLSTLADGIALLNYLFHSEHSVLPSKLKNSYIRWSADHKATRPFKDANLN